MVKLYVEGGGLTSALRSQLREGFRAFFIKAGLKSRLPKVIACGGRSETFDDFCVALRQGNDAAMLLVDSESPVSAASSWRHLADRDKWVRPKSAQDDACHMMVQCMESWMLADRQTLVDFFGQGFHENSLPAPDRPIEEVTKDEVYKALQRATAKCKTKAPYGKGEHSFKLLARIDARAVIAACPSASHLIETLKRS